MKIYSLNPDDTTQKTALLHAMSKGYRICLGDEDGDAEITKKDGTVYHVHQWQCNCPDAIGRNGGNYELPDGRRVCKHSLWLSQMHPCSECNGFMMLCVHSTWRYFTCCTPGCRHMKAFQLVKTERQQAFRLREQEADIDKVVTVAEPPETASALVYG